MTRQESRCGGTVMRTRNWRVVRRPHFLGARDSGMAWRVALVTRLNCILAGVLSRIFTPVHGTDVQATAIDSRHDGQTGGILTWMRLVVGRGDG